MRTDELTDPVGQDKPVHDATQVYDAKLGKYDPPLEIVRAKRSLDQAASTVSPLGPLSSGR
jgi:hypothetical protein